MDVGLCVRQHRCECFLFGRELHLHVSQPTLTSCCSRLVLGVCC